MLESPWGLGSHPWALGSHPWALGAHPQGLGNLFPVSFFPLFLYFLAHPKGFAELLQPRLRSHRFCGAKGASVFTLAAVMGRGIKKK